jgi:hypothetical protein
MSTSEQTVWIIIGALSLANVVVSLLVLRSRYYSVPQKLAQCFIVWAIPLLGPIGIWALLRAQGHAEIFDTRAYPEPTQKAVAVEVSNAIHDSFGGDGGAAGGGGGD